MDYQEALSRWGARKIARRRGLHLASIDLDSVRVRMDFDGGYACCGGTDPNCYCSFAQSPRAEVAITANLRTDNLHLLPLFGRYQGGDAVQFTIPLADFEFTTVLREILAEADGTVTGPPASRV